MPRDHKWMVSTGQVRPMRRWVIVEGHGVRGRDANIGTVTHDQMFSVMILWGATKTGGEAWIGWLATANHRSTCFSAADLEDASFRQWLAGLPCWEPARLTKALENPGLHLVWRRKD